MAKVKVDDGLYERLKKVATLAGYSSPDEFITHMIEKELLELEGDGGASDAQVIERLKGLGYLE